MSSRNCVCEAEARNDVILGHRLGESTLRRAMLIVARQADTDRQVNWLSSWEKSVLEMRVGSHRFRFDCCQANCYYDASPFSEV